MKKLCLLGLLLLVPTLVFGEELLHEVISEERTISAARSNKELIVTIATPGISKPSYAVKGEVRYDNISGEGYLELVSYFPGDKQYFSRTMAPEGPLMKLSGSSDWREFILPFYATEGKDGKIMEAPEKLVLSAHLPQGGAISLRTVSLFQYNAKESPLLAQVPVNPNAWWSEEQAGGLGGLLGVVGGTLGALIGILTGIGRGRSFVFTLINLALITSAISLTAGVVALTKSQPFIVYYPLLLYGGLTAFVFGLNLRGIKRRYSAIELRKMESIDVTTAR